MGRTGRPKKSKDIEYECLNCGKRYTKPEWEVTGVKFCSRECFFASRRGKPRTDLQVAPQEKTCPRCGATFLVGGAGRGKYHQKYCSVGCSNKALGYQPRPRQLTEVEVAWLGGLFDGEGSIITPRKHNPHSVRLTITNTHYPLLERVLNVTGTGRIIELTRYKKNLKHSPSWN